MILTVFVVIFDFEVGVPGFYLVNLHQFSSLSMAYHVFNQFMSLFVILMHVQMYGVVGALSGSF